MLEILGRFGLLVASVAIFFIARRLHTKAKGGGVKAQKNVAAVIAFVSGLALVGTIVGSWMTDLTTASPYLAAAMFIVAAGGLVVDLWTDKQADKFAFYCSLLLPLAIVFGLAQMSNLGDEIGKNSDRVSSTVDKAGTRGGK